MKKRWILLLVLTAAALLLTACSSASAGNGSAHPYSWKSQSGETLRLTIKNPPQEGWSWVFEDTQDGSLTAEDVTGGSEKKTAFSITGNGTVSVARFACRRDTAPYDASFCIELVLSTTSKGKLTVIDTSYTEFPPTEAVGEEGKPSAICYTADDGGFEIYLDSLGELCEWKAVEYNGTYLSVDSLSYGETGCTCRLTGLSAGETELLLYDMTQAYGFRFAVAVADDLSVTVTECTVGTFTIAAEKIPGMTNVTALVGEINFPQTVRVLQCSTEEGWNAEGQKDCAQLRLMADEKEWELLITKSYSVDTLLSLCYSASDKVSQSKVAVGDYVGKLCTTQAGQSLFWSDQDGRSYVLIAITSGTAQEQLLQTAASLCTAS